MTELQKEATALMSNLYLRRH